MMPCDAPDHSQHPGYEGPARPAGDTRYQRDSPVHIGTTSARRPKTLNSPARVGDGPSSTAFSGPGPRATASNRRTFRLPRRAGLVALFRRSTVSRGRREHDSKALGSPQPSGGQPTGWQGRRPRCGNPRSARAPARATSVFMRPLCQARNVRVLVRPLCGPRSLCSCGFRWGATIFFLGAQRRRAGGAAYFCRAFRVFRFRSLAGYMAPC
jgi:hypothetical protein